MIVRSTKRFHNARIDVDHCVSITSTFGAESFLFPSVGWSTLPVVTFPVLTVSSSPLSIVIVTSAFCFVSLATLMVWSVAVVCVGAASVVFVV